MTTYKVIQHQEVGAGGAASIDFSNIPVDGTYTDLKVLCSVRSTRTDHIDTIGLKFNDSTTGFTGRRVWGAGATNLSYSAGSGTFTYGYGGSTAAIYASDNAFSIHEIYISNYASNVYKTYSVEQAMASASNGGSYPGYVEETVSSVQWANNAAISSISIYPYYGTTWTQYSSATLIGIRKTDRPSAPKATGGIISYVDGYWVHSFTGSGTFTPTTDLTADFLVIAGGGGSGTTNGETAGGGGAGGLRSSVSPTGGGATAESPLVLSSGTAYTVTVGAGGAVGANGTDSSFSGITSVGGGRGGYRNTDGFAGGSGGGAGDYPSGTKYGGAGTAGQGYAGGSTTSSSNPAAGGGGAGGVGGNANAGGARGAGVYNTITGSSVYYAEGGLAGGLGYNGVESVPNIGKGGDGTENIPPYAGGSGIVIVRYAA